MRLVSLFDQFVALDGERFPFERGEHVVTEYSHKFTDEGFLGMASRAGFRARKHWIDRRRRFSVHYLTRSDAEAPVAAP
ncbi:MAG: L-histidine N(alpha)-methyltransferase [Verrucomicrobiales bacterium]